MRLLWCFLISQPLMALTTQYVSFEHPDNWKCELSQGVFICQGTTDPARKESLAMSIATIAGEWDSLESYETYLKTPRTIQDDAGGNLESKISYTRKRNINGYVWIDSLQYNSELPGFWARYLATVQNKLAILITYIVSDEYYPKMAPQFERMIASLKPNTEFDLSTASSQGKEGIPGNNIMGPKAQKDVLSARLNPKKNVALDPKAAKEGTSMTTNYAILFVAVVIIMLIVMRSKRKKKA